MTTLDPISLAATERVAALRRDGAAANRGQAPAIGGASLDAPDHGLGALATRGRAALGRRLVVLGRALEGEAGSRGGSVVARR